MTLLLTLLSSYGCSTGPTSSERGGVSLDEKNDFLKNESWQRQERPSHLEDSAISLCRLKRFSAAEELLILPADIKQSPQDKFERWNEMGGCAYWKQNYDLSRLYYLEALKYALTPSQKAAVHNNIGVTFSSEGHYNQALTYYQKANLFDERLLIPQFNLMELYLQFGLASKAQKFIDNLLKVGARDIEVKRAYANFNLLSGRLAETLKVFSSFSAEELKRRDISNHYALALYLNNQNDKAIFILRESENASQKEMNLQNDSLLKSDFVR